MPKLLASSPVLLVANVRESANYYRDRLGFTYDKIWGEPPRFCMASRDGLIVMLSQVPADEAVDTVWRHANQVWNAYFWVNDARALYEEFVNRGATIEREPTITPYQILEFSVADLDGHSIGFGQAVD